MITHRNFYINGAWVAPADPRDHPVIDPATEEQVATISLGDQADTDAAVAAATAAFPAWAGLSVAERVRHVKNVMKVYETRAHDMGEAIRMEMGAPHDLAHGSQAPCMPWAIEDALEAAKQIHWDRPLGDHAPTDRILMEPIGVVGMITPWNWPISQIALKVFPAMIAGCTMVLKPSEEAPLSGIVFAEILHEAGVPAGVFNLVNGDGPGVGSQLTAHKDVAMISFTGSTRAGRLITKGAAETLKRVGLELGGKGANVIFADADEKAVMRGVRHCMNNSGQSCNAPTRMLVERSRYDEAVSQAAETAQAIKVGPTTEAGRHMGPVVNKSQWEKIQGMIQVGIDEGARLIAGGTGLPENVNRGFYVKPTVFADVSNDMRIAQEEIFGPVLVIIPFEDEADAIRIANDTPYGLTDYVQSTDGAKRNRMARALKAGMIEMNGESRAAGSPFGGVKLSGRAREGGVWGIEEYLESKAISAWSID
ncbi:MAG: aldehyde dehydrogenase family protein [Yoonia sp.]|nr:aldehyde dehydrogenase family protein [Yoonia sp.]